MGVLRETIKTIDPQPDQRKDITAILALISELAEQKVKQYTTEIETSLRNAGTAENRTLPITAIVESYTEYRAFVQSDAENIPTVVGTAVDKFFGKGPEAIIGGIQTLITGAVNAVLGAAVASQEEKSVYFIEVQDYAVVRYDLRIWSRRIYAEGISQHLEYVIAVAGFKSIVDVPKLDFTTFLLYYGEQLKKLGVSVDEASSYLTKAKEVFVLLGGRATGETGEFESAEARELPFPGTVY